VDRLLRHPTYKKYIHRRKKFPAHDEHNRCAPGDVVEIISTRPMSKTKCWAVAKILSQPTPPPNP
jgi:small subunit ribosomal protein S17